MTCVIARAGASAPVYPHTHSGPVLVCGNAWCLHDDYERARERWPDAPAIAVNGAAGEIPAFALFTQHPLKFPKWIELRRGRFGGEFTTHAAGKAHMATNLGRVVPMPWVNYWWEGVASGGTSGWGARRLAEIMGFSPVVLCGMPLSLGGYADGKRGSKQWQDRRAVEHYREMILRDKDWHAGVIGMSGWVREVFGDG